MADISICVPVYKEENSNVAKMLYDLRHVRYGSLAEIVIAEYDPEHKSQLASNFPDVTYVAVNRPGIAFARHQAIMAAEGKIICNFDADCHWLHKDGLKRMIDPIFRGDAVMTCCNNDFDYTQIPAARLSEMEVPQTALNALNAFQKTGWAVLEPGSCINKAVYIEAGGFDDVERWELATMTPRVFHLYPTMLRHVPVSVITSPRRVLKLGELGIDTLNYTKAIRKDKILPV